MKDARGISIPFDRMDKEVIVPESYRLFIITAGSGDNLSYEDIENGYFDYVNWKSYDLDVTLCEDLYEYPEFREGDGGMVLLKDDAESTPLGTIIQAVLEDAGIDETEAACLMGRWLEGVEGA